MATGKSGYFDMPIPTYAAGTATIRFWWQENYDVEGNYSTITLTQIGVMTAHSVRDGTYYVNADITADGSLVARLSGNQYSVYSVSYQFNPLAVNQTGGPIYHDDATGAKSVTLTATLTGDLFSNDAGWTAGSGTTVSVTVDLTTIPRASTINATDANIGAVSIIAVNRKSSAYTHSIQYQFGSLSGYITADGGVSSSEGKFSATSIGWTVPTSFYAQIPKAKTGTCTLTIKTYSGNTQIGDAKTCTFTATAAQSDCTPSVSGTVVDTNEATLALTGDENVLVKFFSDVLATITAEAKNFATITSKAIAGQEVSENTRTIADVETGSFVFAVADSRGYPNSVTVNKTMIPYVQLTNNAEGYRDDPTSGNATLYLKGNYFNGSFGAVENVLSAKYRIGNGGYVDITNYLMIADNAYTAEVPLTGLDYQQIFNIEIVVSDKLNESVSKTISINKGIPLANWSETFWKFNVPVNVSQLIINGKALLDYFMPVGYIYTSSNPTSPAELFGGTWMRITDRFLLAASDTYTAGSTGGATTNTHRHWQTVGFDGEGFYSILGLEYSDSQAFIASTRGNVGMASANNVNTRTDATLHQTIDIMPPYLSVYIWERTA